MTQKEFKEPYKVLCGVCYGYMGESESKEGELSYCGCENDIQDFYHGR